MYQKYFIKHFSESKQYIMWVISAEKLTVWKVLKWDCFAETENCLIDICDEEESIEQGPSDGGSKLPIDQWDKVTQNSLSQ